MIKRKSNKNHFHGISMRNILISTFSTLLVIIFFSCKSNSNKELQYKYLKYADEFIKTTDDEIEKKIRESDSAILERMKQIEILKQEINLNENNFRNDSTEINIIIEKLKELRQKLKADSIGLEHDISAKKNELSLLAANIDSKLKEEDENYKNVIEQLKTEYKELNKKLQEVKRKISEINRRIFKNEDRLEKLKRSFNLLFEGHKKAINSVERSKYRAISEKYSYEITLIDKEHSKITYKSRFLSEQLGELKKLQHNLVDALKEDEFNLGIRLAEDLKKNIAKVSELVSESIRIGVIIKPLFKTSIFFDYLKLGKTVDSNQSNIQNYISTFYAQIPTLKRFLEFYPDYLIYIDGHADRTPYVIRGNYANTRLSRRRALKAKNLMIMGGIDSSKIVLDYFGEFHNVIPIEESEWSLIDTVINRRIDVRIIEIGDTSKLSKNYLKFRNELIIPLNLNRSKQFRHENGFWIEKGYVSHRGELIRIYYDKEAFQSLRIKNEDFDRLMSPMKSQIYTKKYGFEEDGCLRLGNQVRLILNINGKDYKIEICEEGAKTIDEIENKELKTYLRGSKIVANK